MLYLLGRERAAAWVCSAAQALEPGGRLVVKELDVTPSWKARWSRFQEVLATRVMRITEGEELELIPRDDVVAAMRDAGLTREHATARPRAAAPALRGRRNTRTHRRSDGCEPAIPARSERPIL